MNAMAARMRSLYRIAPIIVTGAFLLLSFSPGLVQAFHSGGVGTCKACHTLHESTGSSLPLLRNADASSVCLNCHAGPGAANSPSVFSPDGSAFTPGGDFYWLTRDFSWLEGNSPGHEHGHNIVAADYNLFADPLLLTAPGGSYPSNQLGCTSCHDPHGIARGGTEQNNPPVSGSGSYGEIGSPTQIKGNYRILGGSDYQPPGGARFSNDAPVARQSNARPFGESDISHVDYGFGMTAWCGNCHAGIVNSEHRSGGRAFEHPVDSRDPLDSEQVDMYNSYIKSGDFSGIAATAYLQFVPFERGIEDPQQLDPNNTLGPNMTSNIMCLTCHRAHASAFANAGRWDFNANLLINSHPAEGDIGANSSDVANSYYGRNINLEFGAEQGSFCEKCHGSLIPN